LEEEEGIYKTQEQANEYKEEYKRQKEDEKQWKKGEE
jgi:hypothetical protein